MRRDEPLPADRRAAEARLLSAVARAEWILAACMIGAMLWLLPAARAWLFARAEQMQTSALGHCTAPSELEQLHVVVQARAGRLVVVDCMYVGTRGSRSQ